MHARRALLLFALVLGLSALAAAVSPSREDEQAARSEAAPPRPGAQAVPRTLAFEASEPTSRTARVGDNVVLTVSSGEGGLVTIPRLGQTAAVEPDAPARFDLLAPAAGRYELMLEPTEIGAESRRVGTLVTRP